MKIVAGLKLVSWESNGGNDDKIRSLYLPLFLAYTAFFIILCAFRLETMISNFSFPYAFVLSSVPFLVPRRRSRRRRSCRPSDSPLQRPGHP